MKKKIISILSLFILIFLFTSGVFEELTKLVTWLVTLNYSNPSISVEGQMFVKYSTWIISFSVVGAIFKSLKWFDKDAMKIVYFIVSTLISFGLSYLIMILEKYMLYMAIGIGIFIIFVIAIIIISTIIIVVNKYRKVEKEDGVLQHCSTNE